MQFFRDDEKLNELRVDDRIEMFCTCLVGSNDLSKPLLDSILTDYSVSNLTVIDLNEDKPKPA